MSAATATAALPNNPDPQTGPGRDPVDNAAPAHAHTARVLSLLRKLITFGQDLARTVQQRTAAGALLTVALQFGTRDFALILARITRGLHLANALEARLLSRPARPDAEPAPFRASADRATRTARRAVPRPALPDVPTAEEIAAAVRGRLAAAVIADICRDLGLMPGHALWREVMLVLAEAGGGFGKLFKDVMDRVFTRPAAPPADDAERWAAPGSHPVLACGTGPP